MPFPRRFAPLAVALLAAALLAAACTNDQAPPRSPFGPGTTATVALPSPTATPTPTATASATASPSATTAAAASPVAPGTPVAIDRELAVGKAIEQLAQWLGVEQASINLQAFDTQDFPDSCLGVARPGVACASVVVPGAQVILRDALDQAHEVRMDAAMRRFGWAPQHTARGTVVAVDANAGTVTLDTGSARLTLRRVPGTLEGVQLTALHPGDQLAVGYDGGPQRQGDLVIAWTATP